MFPLIKLHALGLGELTHTRYLGRPLLAELAIVGGRDIALDRLRVRVLSGDEASTLGIDLLSTHYRFDLDLQEASDGNKRLLLRSQQAINEPYLHFVVKLEWPSGSAFREYALLLDVSEAGTSVSELPDKPLNREPFGSDSAMVAGASTSIPRDLSLGATVHVQNGDTFSGIVSALELPLGVSKEEALAAIYALNPTAFVKGNIDALKAGSDLVLPESFSSESSAALSHAPTPTSSSSATFAPVETVETSVLKPLPLGRLNLSNGSPTPTGEGYEVPQMHEHIDGNQEMIDLLIKENAELRDRIERIESSDYLRTLTQLVLAQRVQLEALEARVGQQKAVSALANPTTSVESNRGVVAPTSNYWQIATYILAFILLLLVLAVGVARYFLMARAAENKRKNEGEPLAPRPDEVSVAPNTVSSKVTPIRQRFNAEESYVGPFNSDEKNRLARDKQVKEQVRLKSEEYNRMSSSQAPARIQEMAIPVLVEIDEEVNELLSMAKIYCVAGKYSDARAILSAEDDVESDPRVVDALAQIDEMEKNQST